MYYRVLVPHVCVLQDQFQNMVLHHNFRKTCKLEKKKKTWSHVLKHLMGYFFMKNMCMHSSPLILQLRFTARFQPMNHVLFMPYFVYILLAWLDTIAYLLSSLKTHKTILLMIFHDHEYLFILSLLHENSSTMNKHSLLIQQERLLPSFIS